MGVIYTFFIMLAMMFPIGVLTCSILFSAILCYRYYDAGTGYMPWWLMTIIILGGLVVTVISSYLLYSDKPSFWDAPVKVKRAWIPLWLFNQPKNSSYHNTPIKRVFLRRMLIKVEGGTKKAAFLDEPNKWYDASVYYDIDGS